MKVGINLSTVEISEPGLTEPGLRFATAKSGALQRRADVTFFTPPGHGRGELPLVLLLHGVYGSHWGWAFRGGAHRALQRLVDAGEVPPMMLAMPSDGLWGDGSGYLAHRDADYASWIVEEVPALAALVDPLIRLGKRFICGLSMGGYGALRLGALHARQFSGLSAHSSITDYRQMQGFVEEPLSAFDLKPGEITDAGEAFLLNKEHLPPLRFDCGVEDGLIECNRKLHEQLREAGIPHEYQEFSGGHTWEYWQEHLADSLRFFARC